MTKKNPKRALIRKEQSERDRIRHYDEQSIYGQVTVFRRWISTVQSHGINSRYIPIPYEIIDLTAAFIASLITGDDYVLSTPHGNHLNMFRETVNFIRKTLSKAQLSCSSLVCSLWYIDQYFHQPHIIRTQWHPRDLFLASIVVADKYLADITWLNADWSEWTHYAYSTQDINKLEKQFLEDMHFRLHVTELDYSNFCTYLEFRLHLRQIVGNKFSLSYRDITVLSQSLCPVYCERLKITLRPFQAMILFIKTLAYVLAVYTAVITTVISTAYIAHYIQTMNQGMMMMSVDRLNHTVIQCSIQSQ